MYYRIKIYAAAGLCILEKEVSTYSEGVDQVKWLASSFWGGEENWVVEEMSGRQLLDNLNKDNSSLVVEVRHKDLEISGFIQVRVHKK